MQSQQCEKPFQLNSLGKFHLSMELGSSRRMRKIQISNHIVFCMKNSDSMVVILGFFVKYSNLSKFLFWKRIIQIKSHLEIRKF